MATRATHLKLFLFTSSLMSKLFHQIKVITRLTELKIRAKRQQQQQQQPLFALYIYTLILLNREKKTFFCT